MKRMHLRIAAVTWTLLIVAACSIPGSDLPDVDIELADKAAHFTLFAVLAWLWLRALETPLAWRVALVIGAGIAFGVLTELYQGILPWDRTPDVMDAVANSAGLVFGATVYVFTRPRDST